MPLPLLAVLFPFFGQLPDPTPEHNPQNTVDAILDDTEAPNPVGLNTVRTITLTVNGKSYNDPDLARSAMGCFNNITTEEGNVVHVNYTFRVSSIQITKDNTVSITAMVDNPTHTASFASGTLCQLIECDLNGENQFLRGAHICDDTTGNTITFPDFPTSDDPTRFFFVQAASSLAPEGAIVQEDDFGEGGDGLPVGVIVDECPEEDPPVIFPDTPLPRRGDSSKRRFKRPYWKK